MITYRNNLKQQNKPEEIIIPVSKHIQQFHPDIAFMTNKQTKTHTNKLRNSNNKKASK